LIEEAAAKDPTSSDAHYYLGLVRDERGDARGATEAFLRSRALDLDKPAPAWAPNSDVFTRGVRQVIGKLDALLGRYVREADVFVVDVPGAELVVDGVDPRALMILDRVTTDDGGVEETSRVRVFVYQRNVERAAGMPEKIEEELSAALEREITAVFLEP